MSIEFKVKKAHPDALLPYYAHSGDVGMDLFSLEDCLIKAGERKLIETGLRFEIPENYEIQIRPKSGLALKYGITVLNTPGTIDAGYRGDVGVILINHDKKDYEIKKGQKIAQAVINKIERVLIIETENLSESSRGEGGFGSTGI